MSEKKDPKVNFDSDDPVEQKLWADLGDLPRGLPSNNMRRSFYRDLEQATTSRWTDRLQEWLGFSSSRGWITTVASVLIVLGVGSFQGNTADSEQVRLIALEDNIAMLNRELILDRLQDSMAGQRLRGVVDAEFYVQDDQEIARALLTRATQDRVQSVRAAAISALGPSMTSAAISAELMILLENEESPLVQLALIDLVLRNGSSTQLLHLTNLSDSDKLHPDLVRYIQNSVGRESI